MSRSWNDLPKEILHLILDPKFYPGNENTISQCALVCKRWNVVATHRLYTVVKIRLNSSLSRFNRTVTENVNLAILVKTLDLGMTIDKDDPEQNALIYSLLSKLPNIQHFSSNSAPCFSVFTDNLLESNLSDLRTLGDPMALEFSHEYITCVLHMKNQLQNVLLRGEGWLYSRLLSKLHQFKKLEEIYVEKASTNPVEDLNSIVENCQSLQKLRARLDINTNDDDSGSLTDMRRISLVYTPRPKVHSLSINLGGDDVYHPSLLRYIVHKFPNLKSLQFLMKNTQMIDRSTFTLLVAYLSKLESLNMQTITTGIDRFSDDVGSFWEATHSQNPHRLTSLYIEPELEEADVLLSFGSEDYTGDTTIRFPLSTYNFRNMDLFLRYGEHVGALEINNFTRKTMRRRNPIEGVKLLENLIASSLTACGHLKRITFFECYMKRMEKSIICSTAHFQQLTFKRCDLQESVFETTFGAVNCISSLRLEECRFRDIRDNMVSSFSIDLPSTTIGIITFKSRHNEHYRPRYLLFSISTIAKENIEHGENHYKIDLVTNNAGFFEAISESECNDMKKLNTLHLKICCRSFTLLEVNFSSCTTRLLATSISK